MDFETQTVTGRSGWMSELIGFFSIEPTIDKKGYLGAILVIDDKGIPQEFRVTQAIKPTIIQKQLYGKSLLEYIGVTLCGKPLYNILRVKPVAIIVNQYELVELGAEIDCYLVNVRAIDDTIVINNDIVKESQRIISLNDEIKPLYPTFPRNYNEEKVKECLNIVTKFTTAIDLMEPFNRIRVALDTLSAQDKRFS